jgi:type III secretory pathway component EscR
MGEIKKILHNSELPGRELHNSRLFVDLSENVHIHHREIRLMFGVEEFFEFTDVIKDSAKEVKQYLKRHPEYKEQEVFDGLMVAGGIRQQTTPLQKSPKPHESKYYPNRLQIELQEEKVIDSVHIHYRDYRLVMNIETFREFSGGMKQALDNLDDFLKQNDYNQEEHPFRKVVNHDQWQQQKITLWDRIKYKGKQVLKRILGKV